MIVRSMAARAARAVAARAAASPAASVARPGRTLARALHEKPIRLHETPRLRTVRNWADFAPYVESIKFTFDPAMQGTTASK